MCSDAQHFPRGQWPGKRKSRALVWSGSPLTVWAGELSLLPFLVSEVSHLADTYRWPESLPSLLPRAGGIPQCSLEG